MKLSLGQRVFLAFAGLLVLVLGLAAGVTYYRGNRIAQQAVVEALDDIRTVQAGYETQRFRQLRLISEIFASDPYFSSYVAEATGGDLGLGGEVDTGSIVDQLTERQEDLGFDFAKVLNGSGKVIASTDFSGLTMDDLSQDPLVGPVIKSLESAAGYWFRDEGVFQIAVVPLADEENLVGFLLTGLAVDERFAEEIKDVSGSELVFLYDSKNKLVPLVGTLDDKELEALAGNQAALRAAVDKEPISIELDGKHWLASVKPAGEMASSGGLTLAMTSLDEALADFRAITNVLLIATGISILLALPLSFFVSRGVLSPVRRLATAAIEAARGNYQQRFTPGGNDEVAQLTMAFDSLLSDLREKSDMQGYMANLAKFLPDTLESKSSGGTRKTGHTPSAYLPFALLGIDLRRFVKQADKTAPEETFNLVNASLEHIDNTVKSYGGRLASMAGHRVLVLFEGDDGYKRALTVAGNVLSTLSNQGEGIAAALVQGRAATGRVYMGEESAENQLGLAVYQMDRLLQESVSGQVFITKEIVEEIRKEVAEFKPQVSLGTVSKSKFYSLKAGETNVFQVEGEEATLPGGGATLASATAVTLLADGKPARRKVKVMPGITLGGRYEIISELGAGGMGVVYKAHDHELNDLVALKMLKISGAEGEKEFLDAMKSEIKLARKITHPAVLRTYDYGELEGVPYISMEYVRGLTLKYLMSQSGRIPFSAGLQIAKQVAAGLQAAHAQSVLHRDIKPENVILEHNGNAKLMDFGIARQVTGPGLGALEGAVVGTPRYAAPEQLMGETLDQRADIYAAGVLIYQMYTGEFPFAAKKIDHIIKAKLEQEPDRPSKYWKEIPPALEDLIMKCIARDPKDRLASAEKLLEGLEQLRA